MTQCVKTFIIAMVGQSLIVNTPDLIYNNSKLLLMCVKA